MDWMGLANLSEKNINKMLVNEFYSGIMRSTNEYDNPARFWDDILYTFFNK